MDTKVKEQVPYTHLINEADNQRYDFIDFIAEGSFGKVYKALDTSSNEEVAIKIVNKLLLTTYYPHEADKLALREINIALSLNHTNIVKTIAIFQDYDNYYLVMELITGKSLDVIARGKPLKDKEGWEIMKQCIKGINYLHQNKIAHRDLKPANIMVSEKGLVKIIDFGFSKYFDDEEALKQAVEPSLAESAMKFTTIYATPRLIYARKHNMENSSSKQWMPDKDADTDDVWALGLCFYYLVTGQHFWNVASFTELYIAVENTNEATVKSKVTKLNPNASSRDLTLLSETLRTDLKKRITAEELYKKYIINIVD
jgi:serine/threonine protein kinase